MKQLSDEEIIEEDSIYEVSPLPPLIHIIKSI